MAKKIDGYIKLQIPAGQANPSPPVGPALGQKGVNIMEFCKAFNAKNRRYGAGSSLSNNNRIFQDKSFSMEIKTPPASYYLKKAAGLKPEGKRNRPKGSEAPGREVAGYVTAAQVREIAEAKNERLER